MGRFQRWTGRKGVQALDLISVLDSPVLNLDQLQDPGRQDPVDRVGRSTARTNLLRASNGSTDSTGEDLLGRLDDPVNDPVVAQRIVSL